MAKYDEDLHDNPFFIWLTEKHSDLFAKAADNCWIICVPRSESVSRMKLTQNDFENHILIQENIAGSDCTKEMSIVSLNGKHLDMSGEFIVTRAGYKEEKQVKILFDEMFFNSKDESYQIFCIDQPLEGGIEERHMTAVSLESYEDCRNFLWSDPIASEKIKKTVDQLMEVHSTRLFVSELTPDQVKDIANDIYGKVLEEILKLPNIRKIQTTSGKQFILLATETYTLHYLYPMLFQALCRSDLGDALINRITHKSCDIQPYDLGIKPEYLYNVFKARSCLFLLDKCGSPMEKVRCFKQTVSILSKPLHGNSSSGVSSEALSADELLPMIVYLVLTAEVSSWKTNLYYIQEFHFSQVGSEDIVYYLTSFEAAVEYITNGSLEKNLHHAFGCARLPSNDATPNVSTQIEFFKSICNGDVETFEDIFNINYKLPKNVLATLCHPLCSCNKCSPIIQKFHDDPHRVGLHTRDLLNRNGLHYATLKGHEWILQKLLEPKEFKYEIDYVDVNKQTPLHLACLHGNQRCVLYLLSEGANINSTDRQSNTPLHLACSHGHEECVKALVFHKEGCNIHATNELGDTPLHLAARWNHISIVSLLLEHGADRNCINKIKKTPLMSTFNHKISQILDPQPAASITSKVTDDTDGKESAEQSSVGGASAISQRYKRRSSALQNHPNETDRQMKKLTRAIHDNDITMVKYLFGSSDTADDKGEERDDHCHPLCQCDSCKRSKRGSYSIHLTVYTTDNRGNTPLHKAALHGRTQIVEYLLGLNAQKNPRTKDELVTPLHLACQYNHKDVVMILLMNHADVNPRDLKGNTPLHFACNNGHMDSAALLLIHGADVTVCNDRGDTPLHNAARWNHSILVRELILYGALYSCKNNEDKTPSELTTDEEVLDIIRRAMKGEISVGEYANNRMDHTHADSPGISDDETFEHV